MFFSSPSRALDIIVLMLILSVAVAFIIYRKSKNKILTIFSFSLLCFFSIYFNVGSEFFDIYNLKWIVKFTLWYWPYINIALFVILLISYIKNKNAKNN